MKNDIIYLPEILGFAEAYLLERIDMLNNRIEDSSFSSIRKMLTTEKTKMEIILNYIRVYKTL